MGEVIYINQEYEPSNAAGIFSELDSRVRSRGFIVLPSGNHASVVSADFKSVLSLHFDGNAVAVNPTFWAVERPDLCKEAIKVLTGNDWEYIIEEATDLSVEV